MLLMFFKQGAHCFGKVDGRGLDHGVLVHIVKGGQWTVSQIHFFGNSYGTILIFFLGPTQT